MVPEWRQHRDESITSVRHGEDAEVVEDVCCVEDSGEQPLEVFLVGTSGEEGDDSEKPPGVGAGFLEHWGGE